MEAYPGFTQDSFILPGTKNALPVHMLGQFKSTVKVNLRDVGEVYVHRVLYFSEEDYPYKEIYSRKSSSQFIHGIIRYGNFRMYNHQNFTSDSSYAGLPRIEVVQNLDSIVRTIHPLSIFKVAKEAELTLRSEIDRNYVYLNDSECEKYVDTFLYGSVSELHKNNMCSISGFIEYAMEANAIIVKLDLYVGDDLIPAIAEAVFLDTLGNEIGHLKSFGSNGFVSMTSNMRIAYSTSGGAVSEEFFAPYVFRIFDLSTSHVIFSRYSETNELNGFAIPHSNKGIYEVSDKNGDEIEAYIIDHDKNVMYLLHTHSLCQPPFHASYFSEYCECRTANGLKSNLYYERDLMAVTFKPNPVKSVTQR